MRRRGRPPLEINRDAVADAVAELIVEGGLDAVTIRGTANKLSVSKATLYRSIPTKEHLLGVLLERSMAEMTQLIEDAVSRTDDPAEQLVALVELQVDAAVRMRHYMPLFFGRGDMPQDAYARWQRWVRDYEQAWVEVVRRNIEAGNLPRGDAVITTRLLLGSILWVSRWYRPDDTYTADAIRTTAVDLLNSFRT